MFDIRSAHRHLFLLFQSTRLNKRHALTLRLNHCLAASASCSPYLCRHQFPADRPTQDTNTETDAYHDFLEVENLLETYFTTIDSTMQKLNSIGERLLLLLLPLLFVMLLLLLMLLVMISWSCHHC